MPGRDGRDEPFPDKTKLYTRSLGKPDQFQIVSQKNVEFLTQRFRNE
jgi:hypothetical protein